MTTQPSPGPSQPSATQSKVRTERPNQVPLYWSKEYWSWEPVQNHPNDPEAVFIEVAPVAERVNDIRIFAAMCLRADHVARADMREVAEKAEAILQSLRAHE